MKRLTTLFLLATAVGLAACNKDGVITARPEPVITLDSPDGIYTVKAGRRITITPAVENGEGASFEWLIDNKTVGTDAVYTFSAEEAGTYYLLLRVTNETGSDEAEMRIEVLELAPPVISFPEAVDGVITAAAGGQTVITPSVANGEDLYSRTRGKYLVDFEGDDVSSGRVKAELLMGLGCDAVPQKVMRYIESHGLFGEYREWMEKLRGMESEELLDHSASAVMRAVDLNSRHNLKQDFCKVFEAALLHDNAKERPSLDGLDVPEDSVGTPVLHQFLGAEKAKRDFGVTETDILDAIRYHTTAKPDMTVLEKLIYTADSTSYDREYEPIPQLRAATDADFERGFEEVLAYTYVKLKKKGGRVYPLTEEAVRYYLPLLAAE